MNHSTLIFSNIFYKCRERPKWILNFILLIIFSLLCGWITSINTDFQSQFIKSGLSGEQLEIAENTTKIGMLIGGFFGAFIGVVIYFLIFLIISKFMKSDTKSSMVFSASVLFNLIVTIVRFIVLSIQSAFGLDLVDYNISSLNIFDKGNVFLGAIDLQKIISAYLFGIILYIVLKIKTKNAIVLTIVYLIFILAIAFTGAFIN